MKRFTNGIVFLVAVLLLVFFGGVFAKADTSGPVTPPVLVKDSKGGMDLKAPDNASKAIQRSANHVDYQIKDGATLKDDGSGKTLTTPAEVDSRIISENKDVIMGETDVTVDVSEANLGITEKAGIRPSGINAFTVPFENMFGVLYQSIDKSTTKIDMTLAVRATSRLHWTLSRFNGVTRRMSV